MSRLLSGESAVANLVKIGHCLAEIVCENEEVVKVDTKIPVEVKFFSKGELPFDDSEMVGKNEEIIQPHLVVDAIEPASNRLGVDGDGEIVECPGSPRQVSRRPWFEGRSGFVTLVERPDLVDEGPVVLRCGIDKLDFEWAHLADQDRQLIPFTRAVDAVTVNSRTPIERSRSSRRGNHRGAGADKNRDVVCGRQSCDDDVTAAIVRPISRLDM